MEKTDKNNKYDFTANAPKNIQPKSRSFGLFIAMFWAFFFALALSNVLSPYFSQIISGLLSGITPIIIGIVIAFIFYRMVDFIERVLLKNAFSQSPYKFAFKRTISIVSVLIVIVGILALLLAILIPRVIDVVTRITAGNGDGATQIYNNVVNEICNIAQRWFGAEVSQESIKEVFNKIFDWFLSAVGQINNVLALSLNVLSGLGNFLIGLLLAILLLKDKERISRFCRRFSYAHFKKERADEICVITNNANRILHSYVMCKIIEFTILFVSLGILYTILGLDFTWEIALIIAVFNFIPYIGVFIGAGIAVLISLIFNPINTVLTMMLATTILCLIEFNLIIPFITSSKLKVNAIITMSSTIIGGAMFGMMGMLIAPPIFAIISVIVMGNVELKENHMKYVMELNRARERNMRDEKEQLGIMPLNEGPVKQQSGESKLVETENNNQEELEVFENNPIENLEKEEINNTKIDTAISSKKSTGKPSGTKSAKKTTKNTPNETKSPKTKGK